MELYSFLYFISSIIWLLFFKKISQGVSLSKLFTSFSIGFLLAPLAGFLSLFMKQDVFNITNNGLWSSFGVQFLIVGPIEELTKFMAMFMVNLKSDELKKPIDAIAVAIAAALGFACIENVLYLYAFGFKMTWMRLLLGNMGHTIYSVFWGYAFGAVLTENAAPSLLTIGLILASLAHGAYNFFLEFSYIGAIISFSFSTILFLFILKFIKAEKTR